MKALDGVTVIKARVNCDLTETALLDAMQHLGSPSDVYTVFFHPNDIGVARALYGRHGHGMHEGALNAPFLNFVPDDSLPNNDAWAIEANGKRFESNGA